MNIYTKKTLFNKNDDFIEVEQLPEGEIEISVNYFPSNGDGEQIVLSKEEATAFLGMLTELVNQ